MGGTFRFFSPMPPEPGKTAWNKKIAFYRGCPRVFLRMSMPLADLLFLAFALSVDAFVVAFSYGLLIKQKRLVNGIKLSVSTGTGQFLMPVLGFLLTGSVHQYIAAWDHWLGFAVFTFLGVNVIREGWNHRNEEEHMPQVTSLTLPTLLAVGIATSIDALVAGISIYLSSAQCGPAPTLHAVLLPAAVIGLTTFLCTAAGFFLTRRLHRFPTFHLEAGAGLILIGLGVKMLCDHLC